MVRWLPNASWRRRDFLLEAHAALLHHCAAKASLFRCRVVCHPLLISDEASTVGTAMNGENILLLHCSQSHSWHAGSDQDAGWVGVLVSKDSVNIVLRHKGAIHVVPAADVRPGAATATGSQKHPYPNAFVPNSVSCLFSMSWVGLSLVFARARLRKYKKRETDQHMAPWEAGHQRPRHATETLQRFFFLHLSSVAGMCRLWVRQVAQLLGVLRPRHLHAEIRRGPPYGGDHDDDLQPARWHGRPLQDDTQAGHPAGLLCWTRRTAIHFWGQAQHPRRSRGALWEGRGDSHCADVSIMHKTLEPVACLCAEARCCVCMLPCIYASLVLGKLKNFEWTYNFMGPTCVNQSSSSALRDGLVRSGCFCLLSSWRWQSHPFRGVLLLLGNLELIVGAWCMLSWSVSGVFW